MQTLLPPAAGPPTFQSRPFSFTVSADQRVTDVSVGYDFGGCSGVQTFTGLSVAVGTSPIPSLGQQGWSYTSQTTDGTNYTGVTGVFTSNQAATGTALLLEYKGCGSGGGNWSATKQ